MYNIQRYPSSSNNSLKAWSAADEHLLQYLEPLLHNNSKIAIINDRFGFLACALQKYSPINIINTKSQEKALTHNLSLNNLPWDSLQIANPLDNIQESIDYALIKIPKSLELFRLHLYQISQSLSESGIVVAAFMTKYFSPQMLEIATDFFEEVEQSRAWKKSRLLVLKKVKPLKKSPILHQISFKGDLYKQYFGVFSSKHIDYASQFFIDTIQVPPSCTKALDLASGNGILAKQVQAQAPNIELHLVDDSYLAIASSKLNLEPKNCSFHYDNTLASFEKESFDFVFSNPPFHFEHEINIEVSIELFKQVHLILKINGEFQLVANRHLNYYTHLIKCFNQVEVLAQNEKFIVYNCIK